MKQIVGVVWERNNKEVQITVGMTNSSPYLWASDANRKGLNFVEKKTLRTTACRCVIMAIEEGLTMNKRKAFSFHIYVRTDLLAGKVKHMQYFVFCLFCKVFFFCFFIKVKGMVRKSTNCKYKALSVDDTNALQPFHRYIQTKMWNALENLPPYNQQELLKYLRDDGWLVSV